VKEVKMEGEARRKVIESLMSRGVCSLGNTEAMDQLANDIFSFLWNRVESSLPWEEPEKEGIFFPLKGRMLEHGARAFFNC
jgi:hypothetical protein